VTYALIAVSDRGPGVEDNQKERIFEEFHQVRQGRKVLGQGFGLGLAISRSVVEAHKGTIWVEDNPAGGSIFSVLLPITSEQSETLTQAS
jgi:two-component system, NtrC family, sensor kinase